MNDDASEERSQSVGWLERLGRALGGEPKSREGLVELLGEASTQGLIETDTLAMLKGALGVDELQVRDVMVPRSHMVVLPKTGSLDEILPLIMESGHSRFPVVGEDRDEVEGILLAKDLLQLVSGGQALDLNALLRPAVIIPESKRLNVLLREFRVSKNHMAIVVDEYGGTSGLITIEDVLEEIVGDIDQFGHGQSGPVGPRERAETDESRVGDGLGVGLAVDAALFGFENAYFDALAFESLPRQDSGRVFEISANDDIAGFELDGVGDPVDTVCGTLGERDFLWFGSDQVGDPFAGAVVGVESGRVRVVFS